MLEVEDVRERPVEVISDEGYLLVQRPEGVAGYPPTPLSSTVNSWSQRGHAAWMLAVPVRLTWL